MSSRRKMNEKINSIKNLPHSVKTKAFRIRINLKRPYICMNLKKMNMRTHTTVGKATGKIQLQ